MLTLFKKRKDKAAVLAEDGKTNEQFSEKTTETENPTENITETDLQICDGNDDCGSEKLADAKKESAVTEVFAPAEQNGEKNGGAEFARLAAILGKDEKTVIEECKLFQIRAVMSKLSRAVVRYGVSGGEMKALIKNARASGLGEIAVSPAYLDGVAKAIAGEENLKVCSVVDFPFGESSFKVKYSEIKSSVKKGVDGVLTVINAAALKKENAKSLKKELKKIGKFKNVGKGVAVNAEDAAKDELHQVLKLAEKSNMNYVAFLFGNVTETELTAKLKEINAVKGKMPVKVMANADSVHGVKTLVSLGVDGIITPYAEKIAKELFKEFKIKSEKLV